MKHVYWIEEGWLAGRPGPNCRQWDLMELYQGGFRAIVSLEETDPREILGAGFEHLMLLIPGCTVPGMEAMEEFCRYVEAKLGEGKPVLVHCHYGEGRTGTMLASWCLWKGMGLEEAVGLVLSRKPTAIGFPERLEALRLFAERVQKK
ncbi:MAG: protein-tyrosine phosphatase family protein [Candidatus Hydrothermarchaeota archaeon]